MSIQGPLMNIPSELRILIYQFLFDMDTWDIFRLPGSYDIPGGSCDLYIDSKSNMFVKRRYSTIAFRNFTAILRTCSLFSREAIDVLYDQTIFHIRISDEYFNRKMHPLGPLDQCKFVSRIKQTRIDPDVRQHDSLLALPRMLRQILIRLRSCPPNKRAVQIILSTGCLSGFPTHFLAPEALAEEKDWQDFVRQLTILKDKATYEVRRPNVRENLRERLAQVEQALEA